MIADDNFSLGPYLVVKRSEDADSLEESIKRAMENKRIDWGRRRSRPLTGEAAVQEAKAQLVITQITTWVLVGLTLLVILDRT